MKISINLNEHVYVQLTDSGKQELQRQRDEIYELTKADCFKGEFVIDEDEDGWSKWQLWDLMSKLGRKFNNGMTNPLKTEIKFEGRS